MHNPKKLPKNWIKWLNKPFLDQTISLGKCVVWAISSFRSEEKAWPSVQYETVKLDVDFVEEKVVCRAVSSLVVTVDLKVMQSILNGKTYIWQKHCWKHENNEQCQLVAQWKT